MTESYSSSAKGRPASAVLAGFVLRPGSKILPVATSPAYGFRMTTEDAPKEWSAVAVALGTRVTQERTRLGMTKEALAIRSGLASRYIWRVEEGRQNIQLGNISRLARGLDVTMAELMTDIEKLVDNPEPKLPVKPRGPAARRGG